MRAFGFRWSLERGGNLGVAIALGISTYTQNNEILVTKRNCSTIKHLEEKGIEVVANMVGEILTVQKTAGFQLFIARMDEELESCWSEPCRTPYYSK